MIYYIGDITHIPHSQLLENKIVKVTKDFLINYVKEKKIICLDTETTRRFPKNKYPEDIYSPGLDPIVSKICMIQLGDEYNQFIIDARTEDCYFLKEILEDKNILKILHNAKFDIKHILYNYKILPKNVWDTMLCEKVLYNGEKLKYSLEALADRYLGIKSTSSVDLFNPVEEDDEEEENPFDIFNLIESTPKTVYIDKSTRARFINIGDRPFTLEEILYGADDVIYPYQIYFKQKEGRALSDGLYKPTLGFEVENRFVIQLAKIENRGITIDIPAWKKMYQDNINIYNKKITELNDWVINNHPKFANQLDLFNPKPTCSILWSSPAEVIKFAKYLGICPKEKSKFTGLIEYTVGAKAMFKLLTNENKERFFKNQALEFKAKDDTQAFILNFLLTKKYQQLTTTFGLDWLRYIHPVTNKVYTNYIQIMNTGRMSSTSP